MSKNAVRRKDGLYQAQLQINGKRKTVYGKTEAEALAKLEALRQEFDAPERHALGDLVDLWLSSAPLKESTKANYRNFLQNVDFTDLPVEKVTPDRLQRLYASLTPATAEKLHRILHRAFAVGIMWDWLKENPCDRVFKPAYRTKRKEIWSQAELDAFLSGTEDHWLQPLWVLLISSGLRLGEALALRWDDIQGDKVTVNGTLQRLNGKFVVTTPKTASAVRTVILPPAAIAVLEKVERTSDWVFTKNGKQPLYHSTVQHALKKECDRLGLPHVTPHGLRHLHASLLINESVPITAVSARLGHANPGITMKIYAHALPGQDHKAAEAISRLIK